jgi:hypothetical protein
MAVIGQALINGVAYTHADIKLVLLGVPIIEVTEINYSDTQDVELNYGTGNEPTSRGFGNVNPTASITISKKEYDRVRAVAPGGRIQNIPEFPVGINYTTEAGEFTRDRLNRAKFKGADQSSSQNDSNIMVTLELSIASITWGA